MVLTAARPWHAGGDAPRPGRTAALAAGLDACCIVVFVAIGRSSHHDGVTVGGMASTSWPFAVGALCGWIAGRTWRHPVSVVPAGATIWVICVAVGMVLRVAAGQGTAVAFVIVAFGFLGLAFVGWRGAMLGGARLVGIRKDGPAG